MSKTHDSHASLRTQENDQSNVHALDQVVNPPVMAPPPFQLHAESSPEGPEEAETTQMQEKGEGFSQPVAPPEDNSKPNDTGLPDDLKTGMENLSGMSLDHVKVHYNSPEPAQLQAHAFAQGSDIHLASGQEQHLPHELAHVVQQAEGRVKPTTQMKGMDVNDDVGLEKEADEMGAKAAESVDSKNSGGKEATNKSGNQSKSVISFKGNPMMQMQASNHDNGHTNMLLSKAPLISASSRPIQRIVFSKPPGKQSTAKEITTAKKLKTYATEAKNHHLEIALAEVDPIKLNDLIRDPKRMEFVGNPKDDLQFISWLEENKSESPGIIYAKSGQRKTREGLIKVILDHYEKNENKTNTKIVSKVLQKYERGHEKLLATDVEEIVKKDLAVDYQWTTAGNDGIEHFNSKHGPQIPIKKMKGEQSLEEQKLSSHNTFSFGQKTVGSAEIISIKNGQTLKSIVGESGSGQHAEDQILAGVKQFLNSGKIKDCSGLKLRVTLNQSPCNTPGHQCGKKIADFQSVYGFGLVHVYFARAYGSNEEQLESFQYMKAQGILISPFNANQYMAKEYKEQASRKLGYQEDTEEKMPTDNLGKRMVSDPLSDSDEEDNSLESKDGKRKRKRVQKNH